MDSSTYRERAGVLVSALVVMALIAVGPIQLGVQVYTGQQITFDQTWMVTVAGLAGTAFGFLIGKQSTNGAAPAVTVPVPEAGTTTTTTTVRTADPGQ
jgi:1-aminocyclopropane-1-carboxylate deaminase/D-cysteine desulfhydrase-like pyridoxal-dependent ACC family enzyme